MSFEGYYQKLCKNGHLCCPDVYCDVEECPTCNTPFVWTEIVDQTNDAGSPTELKVKEESVCAHCNTTLSTTYYIPGQKVRKSKIRKVSDGVYLK
jgi:hypothetical protein